MNASPSMPSPVIEHPSGSAAPGSSRRIDTLDWTKGLLIICMVVYHGINYSAFRPLAFQFLAFLPPSFILITGFLAGQVYAAKYDLGTWKPYLRLATRGFKLLLVFTILNLVHCIAIKRGIFEGVGEFAARATSIFLSGNGRTGIFEVLLPIAYFLLLAPVLLWLRSRASGSITGCAAAFFLLCLALERSGNAMKNLDFLSVGFIGMAFGLIPMQTIDRLATKWVPILLLYAVYRLCSHFFGETYSVQIFAAIISVLLLYCCALHLRMGGWFQQQMVVLGQYSLLGYLVQIAVLQGVVKVLGGRPQHVAGVFAVCVMTAIATWVIVKTVHQSRRKSRIVDAGYKTIFA